MCESDYRSSFSDLRRVTEPRLASPSSSTDQQRILYYNNALLFCHWSCLLLVRQSAPMPPSSVFLYNNARYEVLAIVTHAQMGRQSLLCERARWAEGELRLG